jgi:hypothetical protein
MALFSCETSGSVSGHCAANPDDRVGLMALLLQYFVGGIRHLRKLWVDGGYRTQWLAQWVRDLKQTHKIDLEIPSPESQGFEVAPWCWVAKRSFAWLCLMLAAIAEITNA